MSRVKILAAIFLLPTAIACSLVSSKFVRAETSPSAALTGLASSQEEGAMEGVLVTAKKQDSTIAITVVTNAQGQFSFPRTKLDPGQYAVRIRAPGYDLADPGPVEVSG